MWSVSRLTNELNTPEVILFFLLQTVILHKHAQCEILSCNSSCLCPSLTLTEVNRCHAWLYPVVCLLWYLALNSTFQPLSCHCSHILKSVFICLTEHPAWAAILRHLKLLRNYLAFSQNLCTAIEHLYKNSKCTYLILMQVVVVPWDSRLRIILDENWRQENDEKVTPHPSRTSVVQVLLDATSKCFGLEMWWAATRWVCVNVSKHLLQASAANTNHVKKLA